MNKTLNRVAARLQDAALILMLFAALRSDGGLTFWLTPALCGILLGVLGLALSWLCSSDGLHFRRRLFRQKPTIRPTPAEARVIPFPKAG